MAYRDLLFRPVHEMLTPCSKCNDGYHESAFIAGMKVKCEACNGSGWVAGEPQQITLDELERGQQ